MALTVDPIVVPARPEIHCDTLNIERLTLVYNQLQDNYIADVQVSFYTIVDGKKVFARQENGTLITKFVRVPDVYAECANTPELYNAVSAILTALGVLYAKQTAAEVAAKAAADAAKAAADATRAAEVAAALAALNAREAAQAQAQAAPAPTA
jgi:hypothetical protein